MKVFLSWSGVRSHGVAKAFAEWLPTVLTSSKPWISSEDIEKGATWITGIKEALTESKGIGVFFATREALVSPWLNFEAGAIASLGAQRVCVVCVDIEPGEMSPPLGLFQSTRIEREDIFRLLKTLNGQLIEPSSDAVLTKIFERSWAELDESIKQVLADTEKASKKGPRKPSPDQIIADIASGVQRIESRLSTLETASKRLPADWKAKSSNEAVKVWRNLPKTALQQQRETSALLAALREDNEQLSEPNLNALYRLLSGIERSQSVIGKKDRPADAGAESEDE